jgi:hypothetical protein
MKMNNTNIDEINIFNNGDGSYLLKMYMSTDTNECITITVPKAKLDISLTCGRMEQSLELNLEGTVDSI